MAHISFWFMLMVLIYWTEAYMLLKKNAELLVVDSKEKGLEVDAEKAKYMTMLREQDAGRSDSVKIDSNSIERVEEFK
jgi:hypothetical protein